MTKSKLIALAECVEALSGPDRVVDAEIATAMKWWPNGFTRIDVHGPDRRWNDRENLIPKRIDCPAYTSSIESAMMLIPEGWLMSRIVWINDTVEASMHRGFASTTGRSNTPATALTAAALSTIGEVDHG